MSFQDLINKNQEFDRLKKNPVAYFCAEFALSDSLPIYSGGLGVLAADLALEAESYGIPIIGLGLLYRQGYFKQTIDATGHQAERPAFYDLTSLPLTLMTANDKPVQIELTIYGRNISIQVWRYDGQGAPVYLLDTDMPQNSLLDKRLNLSLYPTDRTWRLQQEWILGVAGVRALQTLGFKPSIYHLNESHSAFAACELIRQYLEDGHGNIADALEYTKSKIVYTNHTLIPSGNESFAAAQVRSLLLNQANWPDPNIVDHILTLGRDDQTGNFSMTNLAMNVAGAMSAVSQTHAKVAKKKWPANSLLPITNGVHPGKWQAPSWQKITARLLSGENILDHELWDTHMERKAELAHMVLEKNGVRLDPEVLTITWARRFATYKQPLLLFSDIQRLKSLVQNSSRPLQILISGKAHPGDYEAKEMISKLLEMIRFSHLEQQIVFLQDYSLDIASKLVQGSDVWLNTPKINHEACGTSGMKAALNGVLQCAIPDGWTAEIDLLDVGFSIDPQNAATSLYSLLEAGIVPLYYRRNADDVPDGWCERMRGTLNASQQFTTRRMLHEYCEKLYLPLLKSEKVLS